MTEIDVPLDELPPPPAMPWGSAPHDWDDEGMDPALDRTTQLPPDLAALAAEATAPDRSAGARAGAALARLRLGASLAWRARAERLAAPHPDAAMLARVATTARTVREMEYIKAQRIEQAAELKRIRLGVRAQLWVPVATFVLLVLARRYVLQGGAMTWVVLLYGAGLGAALGSIAWRAAGAAVGRGPGAPAEDLGAEELPSDVARLDAATITSALQAVGFLKDGSGITVTKVKPMPSGNGWSCWVKLPPNLQARAVIDKRHDLAGYLDTVDPCLVMLRGSASNRDLYLWLADTPPLSAAPTSSPLTRAEGRVNGWKGIPLGVSILGEPIVAKLAGTPGWLIAGDPGSGKSFLARLLALGVALDPDALGIWMDPDASGTWEPFSAVGEYLEGSTQADLLAMVERLEELAGPEMERRRAALARYRSGNSMGVAESKVTERIARDRRAGLPQLVVFVEECHALIRSEYKDRVVRALITLATQGRKWGIVLVLLTQYANDRNLPVEIRNVLKTRICLSVETDGAARVALGDTYDASGMDPVGLTADEKGAFYFYGEGHIAPDGPWVLGRADLVDDNEVPPMLERAVRLRQERRPDLLPRASRGDEPEPEGVVLTKALEPGDPEHLVNLVAVFAEGEAELSSQVITDRLAVAHPGLYGRLVPGGVNRWLRPFGLVTVKLKGSTYRDLRGLRLREVEHALVRLTEGQDDGPGVGQ